MKESTADNASGSKRKTGKGASAAEATPDIGADVEQMAESVQRAAHDVGTFVRQNASARPYMTLGVAAGVGFVLGGGLSPRMTTTLLGFGGRMLVNSLLSNITEN